MKNLKLLLTGVLVVSMFTLYAGARRKADKDTNEWRYEIEYAKAGANGSTLVKVWSYSKKSRVGIEQCKKNAVHGVVFKGYTSGTGGISQKALVKDPNATTTKAEFFATFFADGGPYMKYVSAASNTNMEVQRVGKEYKVGVIVTVSKDQLRSDLEAAGVVKGLTSGF